MTDAEDDQEWLAERAAIVWEGGRVPWEQAVEMAQERLRLKKQREARPDADGDGWGTQGNPPTGVFLT